MNNPLKSLKLNWWESYVVSHLLGSNWADNLWNSLAAAFEKWLETNANPTITSVMSFVQAHVGTFLTGFVHLNPFMAAAFQGVIGNLLPALASSLLASIENKIEVKIGATSASTAAPALSASAPATPASPAPATGGAASASAT